MGKGKYRRKRNRAKEKAQQQSQRAPALNEVIRTKSEEKHSDAGEYKTHEKEEKTMGSSELLKGIKITDWCLVIFTAALAVASIYQFTIMGRQLDTMRKEERPWIKMSSTMNLQVNQPITATMHVINSGKTPARAIVGNMVIERVKNGEEPRIDYPLPHSHFTTGLLFPNEPTDIPVAMLQSSQTSGAEQETLMQSELDEFNGNKIFFVVYGTIGYKDFFGVDHWTKICGVQIQQTIPGTFSAQNCTDYSDVDTNVVLPANLDSQGLVV